MYWDSVIARNQCTDPKDVQRITLSTEPTTVESSVTLTSTEPTTVESNVTPTSTEPTTVQQTATTKPFNSVHLSSGDEYESDDEIFDPDYDPTAF